MKSGPSLRGGGVRVLLACPACRSPLALAPPRFAITGNVATPSARPPFACPSCGFYAQLRRGVLVPQPLVLGRRPVMAAQRATLRDAITVEIRKPHRPA